MKQRYRLFRRGVHQLYYVHDALTGKQHSLGTADKATARRLIHARIEADIQPAINLQIARAYLAAADPNISTRTWQWVMEEMVKLKQGETQIRWQRAIKDKSFDSIRKLHVLETRPEHFLAVLEAGKVSSNVYLRRLHNFALDMTWLPWPVIVKRQWPAVRFGVKRAITWTEHQAIVDQERHPERKLFYQLAWYIGASQSDLASLDAADIDWEHRVISFQRLKNRWRGQHAAQICFGAAVEEILKSLPKTGPIFPYLRGCKCKDRATEFRERCHRLGIYGVTLHSYRYSWAERAKACGYPERFAQQALGHNSKAVHRAYAKNAQVKVPSLEDYEKAYTDRKIIPIELQTAQAVMPVPPASLKST